jgi:hypothetical protein
LFLTWNNKGDATLMCAFVRSLEREFGEVEVVSTSFTPELASHHYRLPVLRMPLPPDGFTTRTIHWLARCAFPSLRRT